MIPASLCRLHVAALLAAALSFAAPLAHAREQIVIGMAQYPAPLNPNIDSMLAKSFVLGLTERPFTAYDANWELVCMLCTELPTLVATATANRL